MIILRHEETGAERLVEDSVPYKLLPGEHVIGSTTGLEDDQVEAVLVKYQEETGMGLGNAVKFIADKTGLAKALGKENCSACERRRIVYNNLYKIYKDRGFQGTLDILKEIH